MKVNRVCISLWILVLLCVDTVANNVKIVGDVRVVPSEITNGIAPVEFTVTWDNSWRDQFNYDAVYVFLKYKINNGSNTWEHVLLTGNVELPEGYSATMVSSRNNTDKSEGVMIYRNAIGDGTSPVKVKLHWDINSNGLNSTPFTEGQVFLSAMAIEMVYVPQGAFRAGDPVSVNSFRNKYQGIPAKFDILNERLKINVKDNIVNAENPPAYALNRINDITNGKSNAWVGTTEADQYFQIDFGTKTPVKYMAVESMPGYAPKSWELVGFDAESGDGGVIVARGTDKDWSTSLVCTYPATKRIKLQNPGSYRYYRLKIGALGEKATVAIKNMSMATEDLDAIMDNSVLISSPTVVMDTSNGYITNCIYSPDGDISKGEIQENYPTGYEGFYAMKYEVSQEQYVAFLNKLTLAQQASRTIGSSLTSLKEGQYVFGDAHDSPQNRNGIILASRTSPTAPVVFANNLYKDENYSQDGDGQTLACNYLTPADMRAYADWCGLRPLTELEYEKMSRRPFPEIPFRGEYAWNTAKYTLPGSGDLVNGGKKDETVSNGNVNAGNLLGGPVRVGAFAKNAGSQEASGISFWGLADLSGNLAEIYYNLDTEGRRFCGKLPEHHGDGELEDYGNSDINDNVWPLHHDAFAWRGGSYSTTEDNIKELATSDRTHNKGNYQNMEINVRHPEVTFRLGCSKPVVSANSVLTLQNGVTTQVENAADTVCSGSDYLIRGDVPEGIQGAYSIAWFYSGNGGKTWDLIEGEYGRDLRLSNLMNINTDDGYFKEYQYKRHIYGYNQNVDAVSGIAKIRVVNFDVKLSPDTSFVNVNNTSGTIQLSSKLPLNAFWSYADGAQDTLMYQITPGKYFKHNLRFTDFSIGNVLPAEGVKPLVISWEFYGKYCATQDTVWVKIAPQPGEATSPESVVCGQSFKDNRGSTPQLYHTVKIGAACWMAENLNYKEGGGKCYDDNTENCTRYGRLYSWTEAQNVCPQGWHLPNNNEWTQLLSDLGDARAIKAATNEWKFKGGANDMGTNTEGFNALPAGGYFAHNYANYNTEGGVPSRTAGFYDQAENGINGIRAWWWTSTVASHDYQKSNNAGDVSMPYYVMLDFENSFKQNSGTAGSWVTSIFCGSTQNPYNTTNVTTISNNIKNQFYMSVRCVKDAE